MATDINILLLCSCSFCIVFPCEYNFYISSVFDCLMLLYCSWLYNLLSVQGKGKARLMTGHEGTEKGRGLSLPVLHPSTKNVGSQHHTSAIWPRAKETLYPFAGGWTGLEILLKGNWSFWTPQDFENCLPYPDRHVVYVALPIICNFTPRQVGVNLMLHLSYHYNSLFTPSWYVFGCNIVYWAVLSEFTLTTANTVLIPLRKLFWRNSCHFMNP
jgi:hypothetical protein